MRQNRSVCQLRHTKHDSKTESWPVYKGGGKSLTVKEFFDGDWCSVRLVYNEVLIMSVYWSPNMLAIMAMSGAAL